MKKKKIEKIEWQAPEYAFIEKGPNWFWGLGIIILALFLSALLLKSILFGIFILLAGFSIALYGARKPDLVSFSLSPRGIQVGKRTYPYENLKSFWINYNPPYKKELIVESTKTFMPHIIIMLGEADPEKIRSYLIQFLREEKIEESLADNIFRLLGF